MLRVFCAPRGSASGSASVYSLLEYAISVVFGKVLPEIKKTPNGKPYFPAEPQMHFSLSHARTHVLCAVSDRPVGADIESPRFISDLAIRYFSLPEELSVFSPLDLWVLKESYIKLFGGTLKMVKSVHFSYENGSIVSSANSSFSKLYYIESCSAAISSSYDTFPDSIELV